jgi:hypothetical protein
MRYNDKRAHEAAVTGCSNVFEEEWDGSTQVAGSRREAGEAVVRRSLRAAILLAYTLLVS